ncbi:MAG: hypothetical protein R3190_12195 [Thermoanaerobaculia bacterium]|nr:hypothetical protein [Thermoanaerobaculia bacterium]
MAAGPRRPHLAGGLRLWALALVVAVSPAAGQIRPEPPGSTEHHRPTSPRLEPVPAEDWSAEQRALVDRYAPELRIGNGFRTLLHVPELVEAVVPFVIYTAADSTLAPRHRELLILRSAWLCRSQALWADHAPVARTVGLTPDALRRIARGPAAPGWDGFEATLLRLADELFRNASIRDDTWSALAGRYDVYELLDAVMTVNESVLLATLYNSFGVQPDDGAMARLPADVPWRLDVAAPDPPLTAARVAPLEGEGLRVTRTFARHPRMAAARAGQSRFVNRVSPLSPYHRELLILRIGWNCRAVYEWAKHVGSVGRARDHGLDPERIARGPEAGWDDFDRAHLLAADEIYRDGMVSDATWAALAERYDTRELMSVVMTVANYRLVSASLNALGVQPLESDERFPEVR